MPANEEQSKNLVNALNAYIDAYFEFTATEDPKKRHRIEHDAAKQSSDFEWVTIHTGLSHMSHWGGILKTFGIEPDFKTAKESTDQINYIPKDSVFFHLSQNFEMKDAKGNLVSTTSIEEATQKIKQATSELQITAAEKVFSDLKERLFKTFPKTPAPDKNVQEKIGSLFKETQEALTARFAPPRNDDLLIDSHLGVIAKAEKTAIKS